MKYENVSYTTYLDKTLDLLTNPGLFIVAADANGRPNPMTIGWGMVGVIWGKPIFIVLVRPSRYTYTCMEGSDSFTVCVPSEPLRKAVKFCGTRSGRDYDKFEQCGLSVLPSTQISAPGIAGCPVIYECQVVHTNDLVPDNLAEDIVSRAYPHGDFHRLYYGEIMAVRALPNAVELLGS